MKKSELERSWRRIVRKRSRERGTVEVIELAEGVDFPPFVLPGSITVVAAASGEEALARIAKLAASGDLRKLALELFDAEEALLAVDTSPEELKSRPALGELRCGGKTLLRGLGAPGPEPHAVLLAYAGGDLAPEDFDLDVYVEEPGTGLDALLIASPPQLGEVERAIVAQVDKAEARVLAEPAFWPAATKEAGKFVVTYLTDKAVDRLVQAERDAAKRRQRAEEMAKRIGQKNARRKYRNAQLMPEDTLVRRLAREADVDPAQSTEKLLEARRQMLREALDN